MKIYYNKNLKKRSRRLRNNSTLSEVLLWNELKARKMKGYQFMRQKPILYYIVDFYCSKLSLVIEIDGSSHINREAEDQERQQNIEALGISFLRFDNNDVNQNMPQVLKAIEVWIEGREKSLS